MTAFWSMVPYSLIKIDWHFKGAYCLHHQGDHPDDGDKTQYHENLMSYNIYFTFYFYPTFYVFYDGV
jgi:hypothetical protein